MRNKYEVQTKFVYGWENVWSDDKEKLVVFDTKEEAQAEIKDTVDSWNRDPNTKHNIFTSDYRVIHTDENNHLWLIIA